MKLKYLFAAATGGAVYSGVRCKLTSAEDSCKSKDLI
jgi:hypothetical protein